MGYVRGHYYRNGASGTCVSLANFWISGSGSSIDGNDSKRTSVSSMYYTNFGRYGEWSGSGLNGVEFYVAEWVNGGLSYSQVNQKVKDNATGSDLTALNGAKHSWGGLGFCPPPPPPPPPEPTASLSASPTSIIAGPGISSTLTYSSTNGQSYSLTSVASPGASGTATVSPTSTTTYTYTVNGAAGTTAATATATVTVYIKPVLTLTLGSASIINGNSTNLSWSHTGDANSITWTAGGITNLNLNSNTSVSPTVTTTYTGYVSGNGGQSADASIVLTVYYQPTLIVTYPESIDYGEQAKIEYEGNYADSSVKLSVTYNYEVVPATSDPDVDLNIASSAELSTPDPVTGISASEYSGEYDTNIVYNNRGPFSVSYSIVATGSGGSSTQAFTIPIDVDRTPDNMSIAESEDLLKDQPNVITPDSDVLSEFYEVNDIDVLVEIKANWPINVDVNQSGIWQKVREL